MAELETLEMRNRRQWRAWLERHHASSPGVWLAFPKNHSGDQSLPYDDSVREALCFGWIDSLIKRLDDDRYVRKFTPRKPSSQWSDSNRRRWAELKTDGLLAEAGLAASPTGKLSVRSREIPDLPEYFAEALKSNPKAQSYFQTLAPSYRRVFVGWVHTAVRPETRDKRLRESLALLAAGKKLG